jgi:hypothetical protein
MLSQEEDLVGARRPVGSWSPSRENRLHKPVPNALAEVRISIQTGTVLVKLQPLRFTLNIQIVFDRPIFDWTGVMQKFFDMIFRSVGARIPVVMNEFSAYAPGRVSEMYARYNVYGGPSSVSLFADKLIIDFPNLLPGDISLVRELLKIVHDGFAAEFTQASYSRVDVQSGSHLEVLAPDTVKQFLSQYRIESVENTFGAAGAVTEPAIRFAAKSSKPQWTYALMIEQSLMHAAALFLYTNLSLTDAAALPTFEEEIGLVAYVGGLALKAFGVEQTDGTTT